MGGEYNDMCLNQVRKKSVVAGQCQQFAGGFHGIYKLMFRGEPCELEKDRCSTLRIVHQEFFQSITCKGLTTAKFSFPLHKECLRFENGTQTYQLNEEMTNVTQTDHHGSSVCDSPWAVKYYAEVDRCYPLYGDFAFKWRLDIVQVSTESGFGDGQHAPDHTDTIVLVVVVIVVVVILIVIVYVAVVVIAVAVTVTRVIYYVIFAAAVIVSVVLAMLTDPIILVFMLLGVAGFVLAVMIARYVMLKVGK